MMKSATDNTKMKFFNIYDEFVTNDSKIKEKYYSDEVHLNIKGVIKLEKIVNQRFITLNKVSLSKKFKKINKDI